MDSPSFLNFIEITMMKQKQTLPILPVLFSRVQTPPLLRAPFWFLVSLLLALLSGLLLFARVAELVTSGIIQAGFDQQRAQLTSALLLAACAALLGATLTQRKFGAMVGAVLAFSLCYLVPFLQQEVHPDLGYEAVTWNHSMTRPSFIRLV